MITYDRSAFGFNLILRVHGSAVYRSVIPGCLSILCLLLIRYLRNGDFSGDDHEENDLQHPYAIGVLVGSTTFLIVFRINQGYSRYWEAASCCFQMSRYGTLQLALEEKTVVSTSFLWFIYFITKQNLTEIFLFFLFHYAILHAQQMDGRRHSYCLLSHAVCSL